MKKLILNKTILSIFIMSLFFSNILLVNVIKSVHFQENSLSVIEQFYTITSLPTKVLFDIMFSKDATTNKKSTKQNKSKNDSKDYNKNDIICYSLNLNIFSATNRIISFCANNVLFSCLYEHKIMEYPLKIPFCFMCVFLLLLLKLLFNILPRSISINYNKMNIERACIV